MVGIYKAYDIRGIYGDNLTELDAYLIGLASAHRLYNNTGKIVVSQDMRSHSNLLRQELIRGLTDGGCDVVFIGLAATPMNYWANNKYQADGSIQVTASHNSAPYNGFKFSLGSTIPVSYDSGINKIEEFVQKYKTDLAAAPVVEKKGIIEKKDNAEVLTEYLAWQKAALGIINKPLRIAVDCANGMGGHFVRQFFHGMKNIEIVLLYEELDGSFPNHEADPIKPKNLKDLQKLVLEYNCDFGIGFDGDADRSAFVDEKGKIITSDLMIVPIAEQYIKNNDTKYMVRIGHDLRSSMIVAEKINHEGGYAIRTKVGHSHIKKQMREENIVFAGELSGHFYYKDCFYTDSGLMTLIQVMNILTNSSKTLSEIIDPLRLYFASGEESYKVADIEQIIHEVKTFYSHLQQDELDGLTVKGEDWWFNLRPSNTEPLLRLNLEAKSQELLTEKLKEVHSFFGVEGQADH